ncbi:spexin prohormone 1 isoform X3 [Hippocampus zosterae]|uniref:spexin prohormone 1 isoform X3 n=1 Tax=Hippocampus zosterae TaxID=109293 RepID=UPI00223E0306|nr:spexin prohormone 1 isoform X3 [Hippocampus zosterae]
MRRRKSSRSDSGPFHPSRHRTCALSFTMNGLKTITLTYILTLLLVAFVTQTWSAPKGSFQRRNWTPQAMLYLKGTQTRSQNTEKLNVDQAATILLNFLQQARDGADENLEEVYFQEMPVWKREYF